MAERVTVRCGACRLVQFATASGRCRRCGGALREPEAVPAPAAPPEIDAPPASWRHRTDEVAAAFGKYLRVTRLQQGLSQGKLSALAGYPRSYLSRIENGHTVASLHTLLRLHGALRFSFDAMLRELGGSNVQQHE